MATDDVVTTEMRGSALWITLDQPKSLNAIGLRTAAALNGVLDAVEHGGYPGLRAVVLTGAGRAFCAGGNLSEMADDAGGYRTAASLFGAISALLVRLEASPLPVIAAVNGMAIAGGLELVLACDLVVAAEDAVFGDGHANYGLLPGGGGSVRLPRKIGVNRAKYMMMTGRTFPARVLSEWGLVNEVVPADGLEAAVAALVSELEAKSPLGLSRMKQLIDGGLDRTVQDALAAEFATCALHDASFDRNEGLAAFAGKRRPSFKGL